MIVDGGERVVEAFTRSARVRVDIVEQRRPEASRVGLATHEPITVAKDRTNERSGRRSKVDHVHVIGSESECEVGTERQVRIHVSRFAGARVRKDDGHVDVAPIVRLAAGPRAEQEADADWVVRQRGGHGLTDRLIVTTRWSHSGT